MGDGVLMCASVPILHTSWQVGLHTGQGYIIAFQSYPWAGSEVLRDGGQSTTEAHTTQGKLLTVAKATGEVSVVGV